MGKNAIRIFFGLLTLISGYFAFLNETTPEEIKNMLVIVTICLGIIFLVSLFMIKALDQVFGFSKNE